jgi:DNA-binding NarL/FixJ family response regulator
MKITLGIADDQQLFLKALKELINTFEGFKVVVDALEGKDLLTGIALLPEPPDIVLLDVNMPVMNGIDTVREIAARYPLVRMAALSMKDDDMSIISMLRAGCCAYFGKDIHPDELKMAIAMIMEQGYYNPHRSNNDFTRLRTLARQQPETLLNAKERKFLQLACSDLTYKQIASEMNMSERTIDGYRESLFEKFNVQSRVGMVLEAIRRNLVQV